MRTLRHTLFTALLICSAHAAAQTLTTLATFTSAPDGSDPSGLVIGSNGVLYGVTQSGGTKNKWRGIFPDAAQIYRRALD